MPPPRRRGAVVGTPDRRRRRYRRRGGRWRRLVLGCDARRDCAGGRCRGEQGAPRARVRDDDGHTGRRFCVLAAADVPPPPPFLPLPSTIDTMTGVTFRLHASSPPADTYVRVVGGHPALGDWSPATAPSLARTLDGDDAPATVTVSLSPGEAVEYKYARVDAAAGTVTWEGGDNRRVEVAPGAVVTDHWGGGESPTLPCEGIVVPSPPVEAAPSTAGDGAPPPADASGPPPTDAPLPPADGSPPPSDGAPADASDACAPPDDAPVPPADVPEPSPRVGKESAADDTTVTDDMPIADGGGEAEAAAKGGGDANIFKHLSSGVSSLLRAMSRGDGGRGRENSTSPQPTNGVGQADS